MPTDDVYQSSCIQWTHLSGAESGSLALLLSVLFVASLHVFTGSAFVPRDSPKKIVQRFWRSSIACFICCFILWISSSVCTCDESQLCRPFMTHLGLGLNNRYPIISNWCPCFSAVIALFLGNFLIVLYETQWSLRSVVLDIWDTIRYEGKDHNVRLIWCRNYLVAPAVEEFVFRACIIPVLLPNLGWRRTVLISPLLFGVAHLHHAFEQYRLRRPVASILSAVTFQMMYTSLFGCYSAYVFVASDDLSLVIALHVFCNFAGFPDLDAIFSCPSRLTKTFILSSYLMGVATFIYINVHYFHPDHLL